MAYRIVNASYPMGRLSREAIRMLHSLYNDGGRTMACTSTVQELLDQGFIIGIPQYETYWLRYGITQSGSKAIGRHRE